MALTDTNPNARRLRWALLIALALHVALLSRYVPQWFARLDLALPSAAPAQAPLQEQIVEIAPLSPPPKSRGMAMATALGGGSTEPLQEPLPADFFPKPAAQASGTLQLADGLATGAAASDEIAASIIPAAVRLPNINALSDQARTPAPKPATTKAPVTAAPLKPLPALVTATAPLPETPTRSSPQVPFLLPPAPESYDVEAAIHRVAVAAEQAARAAQSEVLQSKQPIDFRALLSQGPLVAAPPLPLEDANAVKEASAMPEASGITTYALDAPLAQDKNRAAPDQGKTVAASRQQYFALLTAQLKAANQRQLAEAVKAGPRAIVRLKFLVDREGRVLEITPTEPVNRKWVERASAVIRAAPLPRVPDAMTQVPVELSFPVEVYQ